jgi:DNA processing protein
VAFPGSGLGERVIYPRQNMHLAESILHAGGCLVSEYPEHEPGNSWSFPRRNRLLAGLSRATLLIEAMHDSGSRITARLATEYNRDVLAVPGSIFSELSQAPNELLRLGATPITSAPELLEALGFELSAQPPLDLFSLCTPEEESVLRLLARPRSRGELVRELGISIQEANALLSSLEIKGMIKEHGGDMRRI